jgi:hypothetical protein
MRLIIIIVIPRTAAAVAAFTPQDESISSLLLVLIGM